MSVIKASEAGPELQKLIDRGVFLRAIVVHDAKVIAKSPWSDNFKGVRDHAGTFLRHFYDANITCTVWISWADIYGMDRSDLIDLMLYDPLPSTEGGDILFCKLFEPNIKLT